MKTSCDIIQDLLPLYVDGVCSGDSRALVEEHLAECPACRAALGGLRAPLPAPEETEDRAALERLAGAVDRRRRRAFLKGAVIAAAVCAVLFGGFLVLTQWKVPIDASQMEVTDVCELRNGMIAYRAVFTGGLPSDFRHAATPEGDLYLIPCRRLWGEGNGGLCFGADGSWRLLDRSEENTWREIHGNGVHLRAFYLGEPGNAVLVWEEGMDLPPAGEAVEAIWNFPAEYPRNY